MQPQPDRAPPPRKIWLHRREVRVVRGRLVRRGQPGPGRTVVAVRADWREGFMAALWLDSHARTRIVLRLLAIGYRLSPELCPLPFGNHLDRAVDNLDGRLFVDGVGRDTDFGGPPLRVGRGVGREGVQVREDREFDESQ